MRSADQRILRRLLITATLLAVAGVLGAAVYELGAAFMNFSIHQPSVADLPVAAGGGSASSQVLGFSFLDHPRAVAPLWFSDGEGHDLTLADFRSRPVLLNIWATWCVPCRQEMPSLDRLQSMVGKSQLLVLPLSIDRQGAATVRRFYRELGLKALEIYLDPSANASRDLATVGVPTTLLIDRDGREIGRKIGAAEWDSAAVVELLRRRLILPPVGQAGP
jgi:thiol-disulfide isomerase/thioredoxin